MRQKRRFYFYFDKYEITVNYSRENRAFVRVCKKRGTFPRGNFIFRGATKSLVTFVFLCSSWFLAVFGDLFNFIE